jgi:hypothetical protein
MAYRLPNFNLTARVIRPPTVYPAFDFATPANLSVAEVNAVTLKWPIAGDGSPSLLLIMILRVPALTDIRSPFPANPVQDFVEVPAGSGRLYAVCDVDDQGKGFPNEHRLVLLTKAGGAGTWPFPMP